MKTPLKYIVYVLLLIASVNFELNAQIGRLPLSPSQRIEQNIGLTDIIIEYSRPSKRGREIFGALVPYGKYWRTGANKNTTISFNQDVFINKERIKKGKYAIFSIPNPSEWEIIFYKDTDNWNVPEVIDTAKIVSKVKVVPVQLNTKKEVLTIEIGDFTNYQFDLNIAWDHTLVSVPIELSTKELMDKKISSHLEGPTYDDYYLAAVYQMESGKEFTKGLNWINKAIAIAKNAGWWDLRVKAILLKELGKNTEALKVAEEGMKKAKNDRRNSAVVEFNRILNELNK
ncbi:DUF2911 domain-containing protein [Aquimarina rubra]|uniref:DUF2911 domain-containing protein n=1 Tax=Aquimarina rubra TaxID=1920033 RepID=A0ABW5LCD8_9FLAO